MSAEAAFEMGAHTDAGTVVLGNASLVADPAGVIYWPEERLLAVADLHLEKGSSYARYGFFLPPYDSTATLARLGDMIRRYEPKVVIALGDSFHDGDGPGRLSDIDRATLRDMQRDRDWIWIAGNHDPDPATEIGGYFCATMKVGALTFRHEPVGHAADYEIAGHLHPVARVSTRARTISRRCFATSPQRVVMPAFGAYTGGLNVRHQAFEQVFGALGFVAHMLGETRLYSVPAAYCLPD